VKVSVFVATSMDGYIAREDNSIDWLENLEANGDQDYGYHEFISNIDAILMGRNTFDVVKKLKDWSYNGMPIFVLTHHPLDLHPGKYTNVHPIQGEPRQVLADLEKRGFNHLYIDGGKTITEFLSASLVDEMIITRIPILLGKGIPLFGSLEKEIKLELKSTIDFKDGLIQNTYKVFK